jgi:transposase
VLQQKSISPVREETERIAGTAFPKGNIYITMRNEIGTLYNDQDFEALFPGAWATSF